MNMWAVVSESSVAWSASRVEAKAAVDALKSAGISAVVHKVGIPKGRPAIAAWLNSASAVLPSAKVTEAPVSETPAPVPLPSQETIDLHSVNLSPSEPTVGV